MIVDQVIPEDEADTPLQEYFSAIESYKAAHSSELSIKKGAYLKLVKKDSVDGKSTVLDEKGNTGDVPTFYLKPVPSVPKKSLAHFEKAEKKKIKKSRGSIRRKKEKILNHLIGNRPPPSTLEEKNILKSSKHRGMRERVEVLKGALDKTPAKTKITSGPVFGVPLPHLMYISYTDFVCPQIVTDCIQQLRKPGVTKTEGLFRISGNQEDIMLWKNSYDSGKPVDLSNKNPHSVAGLLKLFFRKLPEPLLTFRLYDAWVSSISLSGEDRLSSSCGLVASLPETHSLVLKELLTLLHEVAEQREINKMTYSNLGIVFGPTLLQKQGANPIEATLATSSVCEIASYLIEHVFQLFPKTEATAVGDVKESDAPTEVPPPPPCK